MAATPRSRALAPALLVALALGTASAPAAAVEAVPDERAFALEVGSSRGAMVGDVDGDGVRELVGLFPWSSNPGQLALHVFGTRGGDGEPASRGEWRLGRAAAPDDTFAGNNPEGAPLLPLSVSDPARLLAIRIDGRERVLVATMQGPTADPGIGRPCCLTLWWVTLDEDGFTELELIQNTAVSAAWIVAADMDADGTDELAVVETPDPVLPAASRVRVLRWTGTDFRMLTATAQEGLISGPLTVLGESDGLPGDEVGYTALPAGDGFGATLHRIALDGDALRTDRAELSVMGSVVGFPGPDGGLIALVGRDSVEMLRWPAGSNEPVSETARPQGGRLLGVLGTGDQARLLLVRLGVEAVDWRLRSSRGIPGGVAAARFIASSWPPYGGELPGGDASGRPAFVYNGRLITAAETPATGASADLIAALPGRVPVGFFGERNEWAAVAVGVALPVSRHGGALTVVGARSAVVHVVSTRTLLEAEADGGLLAPPIEGAILEDADEMQPLLVTSGAVSATIRGPAGREVAIVGEAGVRDESLGPGDDPRVQLVEDDPAATEDESFTLRLLVVTPAGHGYGATWEVRVLRRPPTLVATSPFAPLSFDVPLSGRTVPTAQLLVDEEPVQVQPDGSFRTDVEAGLLPRTVRLRAIDRVGNVSDLALEVVAVLDYRRLPWIPIVAGLTLLAGAILYLRAPKPSAIGAGDPDEGVLEEIQ